MRLRVLIACALLPAALWALLPVGSEGASPQSRIAALQERMEEARRRLEARRGRERVLSGDIAAYSRRINRLQDDIAGLQRRQVRIQADLDAKRAELIRIQAALRRERARLAHLRARLALARRTLSARLVALYKSDTPDYLTVLLNAKGFADLLERGEFMRRVGEQDRRIIERVRTARADALATAQRLDRLEIRQQRVTAVVLARRNQVAAVRRDLDRTRDGYAANRAGKARLLAASREKSHHLRQHLAELEATSRQVEAQLAAQQGRAPGAPGVAGPIRRGSGSLIWPVNGAVSSPFGPRWGRLHAGIDISAPSGTPIRAADSGRVVMLGVVGGYGNYTCVQHTASMSTCYAHQSRYATSQGASVRQGQVIGYVGCTGHCFGDHLHFEVRIGGSPVNPMGYL